MATLFMIWHLGQTGAPKADRPGVGAVEQVRWTQYGISSEAYESHRELVEFGLLEMHDTVLTRRLGKV